MANSAASKNLAMQLTQGAYKGLKSIGTSIRNVVDKRMQVQKMYEDDQAQGVGNRYESTSAVMKRHGMK
jgi:hypothetical protein